VSQDQETPSANPYTSLPRPITEQYRRNAVSLLQGNGKALEVHLKDPERFSTVQSKHLDALASRVEQRKTERGEVGTETSVGA